MVQNMLLILIKYLHISFIRQFLMIRTIQGPLNMSPWWPTNGKSLLSFTGGVFALEWNYPSRTIFLDGGREHTGSSAFQTGKVCGQSHTHISHPHPCSLNLSGRDSPAALHLLEVGLGGWVDPRLQYVLQISQVIPPCSSYWKSYSSSRGSWEDRLVESHQPHWT